MSKFTILKGSNGDYYFNLKAGNGERVLASEGYTYKSSCENGITSVKENATNDSRYEKKTSYNNKYYFVLKAANGQVIGTSEMYETSSGRDNGIAVVKREAPSAIVEDLT
ncbi:YegP family protein [Sediminibacterium sp.]|uniref:YegP family protein n=1 Tax=Sediminibacterium sp. TaxID=1917865 RepID=UPI003F6F1F7E